MKPPASRENQYPRRLGSLAIFMWAKVACSSREVDATDDCVPERPEHGSPANVLEPCDISQGSRANAADAECEYYTCLDGIWVPDGPEPACRQFVVEPILGSNRSRYCAPRCLADLEPTTAHLDSYCHLLIEDENSQNGVSPARCVATEAGWTLPTTEVACYGLTTADGVGNARLDDVCVERGINAGLVVLGDVEAVAPPDFLFLARCSLELYPQSPCPGAGDPNDEPRLCE